MDVDFSLLWRLLQSFSQFGLFGIIFALCQKAAPTQSCDGFFFLLKKTAGHLFLHFNGVTFSTDITEEGVSAVLVETEQKRTQPPS